MTDWIKTDDFQIYRQLDKNQYEFVEFLGCSDADSMWYSHGIVDVSEYKDADGEWNAEAQDIISSYYRDLEDLRNNCDKEKEDQIVAECIFESYYHMYCDGKTQMSEDEAEKYLNDIMAGRATVKE